MARKASKQSWCYNIVIRIIESPWRQVISLKQILLLLDDILFTKIRAILFTAITPTSLFITVAKEPPLNRNIVSRDSYSYMINS